ncbi:hypothetical protein C2869_01840 [Saccharobesus litoralis]|uniref:Uncharacterized protein n=1 Tax=Saccharobesus litoralis TaxID=2172099 RepID=A0A2S0VM52_9ALTE|nr:hypothetical protein [Saccharobesus litoralis]AWB65262.1 hypothetical protein C2869_01840 [Saccharobesus litoralis]
MTTSLGSHQDWKEGVSICFLVLFLPLTAITYIRVSLPKKHESVANLKQQFESHDLPDTFSFHLNQDHKPTDYFLPLLLVSLICIVFFTILLSNSAMLLFDGITWVDNADFLGMSHAFKRNVVCAAMAFLGAYVWAIQFIFRRMMTLDLPPGAYYSVVMRMIYSVLVAVVFQYFMQDKAQEFEAQFLVISFFIGLFPERAIMFMREGLSHIFARGKHSANELQLDMIEGINGFHKSRLTELGIDNVQNLAHASLIEVIIKTSYKPRVIVDWMAQARLCLEFKNETNLIRKAGIRTIIDLIEVYEHGCPDAMQSISDNSGINKTLIDTVCLVNAQEESIGQLRSAYDTLNII